MRRPGLLLLIALLALRMWVGDAMAWASPLPTPDQAAAAAQAPCHEAAAGQEPTQHLHAASGTSGSACDAGDDASPGSCGACQVCHSPLLAAPLSTPLAAGAPQATRAWAPARFKSVSLAPQFKPPIA